MNADVTDSTGPRIAPRVLLLALARLREFFREPWAIFWVYGFPLLMALALGTAFRNRPVEEIRIDVVESPAARLKPQVRKFADWLVAETHSETLDAPAGEAAA